MLRKIEENVKIIISLTTYPKRMQTIRLVLESLLSQTYLPDKIVLWLSEEEFDKNTLQCVLPLSEEVDIEIRWCEKNLRSHKKYYYAMQEFPDDIIITVDDDVIYKDTMIENLIKGYRCYPYAVIARRAHLITKTEDGNIAPYREWYQECTRYLNEPRMDLVATGVGGVLYPPHILPKMTFDEAAILKICKYADDMWLKVMEVINNVPLVLVEESLDDKDIVEYIGDGLYTTQNAGSGNDEQLSLLIKKYNNCNLQDMNDTLLKRILKNDAMRMRDVKNAQYADEKQRIDAMMLKWEKYDKLIIYGAGYIAGLVFEEMLSYNLHKRIKVFAVCSTADNPSSYYGVKVDAYTNYIEDDSMIVLGVSKEKQIAVSRQLMNAGVGKERIIKLTGQEIKALKDSSKLCRNK